MFTRLPILCTFFFWILLSLPLFLIGQTKTFYEQGYKVEHYASEYGFKFDEITDIKQDEHGYIWMLNFDYLVRFDGYEFKFYRPRKSLKSSNHDDYFYHLSIDLDGYILCSTFGKILWKFEPITESFEPIDLGTGGIRGPHRTLVQDTIKKIYGLG